MNRRGQTAGLTGPHVHVHHLNEADKVIAFHRWQQGGPQDSVVVLANLANRHYEQYLTGFPRAGVWKVRFDSDRNTYDPDFEHSLSYDAIANQGPMDGMPCSGSVGLGPYSVVILSQDK